VGPQGGEGKWEGRGERGELEPNFDCGFGRGIEATVIMLSSAIGIIIVPDFTFLYLLCVLLNAIIHFERSL